MGIVLIFVLTLITGAADAKTTDIVTGQGGHESWGGGSPLFMRLFGRSWFWARIGVPLLIIGLFWTVGADQAVYGIGSVLSLGGAWAAWHNYREIRR